MEGKKDESFQKLCYSLSQSEVLDSQIQQIGTQIFMSKYFSVVIIDKSYPNLDFWIFLKTEQNEQDET